MQFLLRCNILILMASAVLILVGNAAFVAAQDSLFDRRSRRPWWTEPRAGELDRAYRLPQVEGDEDGLRLVDSDLPFSVDASLIMDGSHSLYGGRTTHRGAFRNLFELSVSAYTEPLFGLEGGTIQFMFQNHAGTNGSDLIGDLQGFSNIDANGRTQVSEVWYEQLLDDDQWRFRIGKMDANSQFAFVEHGLSFLNSSMGVTPTIFVMPTYPDPSFGASLFYEPDEGFYSGLGLFDGAGVRGIPTGARGIDTLLNGSDFFLIGESGLKWNLGGTDVNDEAAFPGRLGIGGWFHDGAFERFDGRTQSGTGGVYAVFDQLLMREYGDPTGTQGLGVFVQYGYANPNVSAITQHFGTGLTVTGLFPERDADRLGVGISFAGLSDQPGAGFRDRTEFTTELFYEAHFNDHTSVVFDVQHIANPGGDGVTKDAVVGTVRFVLTGSLSDLFSEQ